MGEERTHAAAVDVGECTGEVDTGPVVEQCADDKGAVGHAKIGVVGSGNRRESVVVWCLRKERGLNQMITMRRTLHL
jgi:hypothetical protein